jgi:signal peptidase I
VGVVRSGLGFLSWVGAAVIVIALLLKFIWFDMASVGHNGMAPTLIRGERVLINRRGEPALGSIAVCQHPTEDGWVVGRVAATGGMTIDSYGSELRVDGEPIQFDRRGVTSFHNLDNDRKRSLAWGKEYFATSDHLIFMEDGGRHLVDETSVPEGKLYLLGDFRAYMGQDSRAYGVVDASTCRGTIVFRVTPAEGLDREIAHRYFQPVQ